MLHCNRHTDRTQPAAQQRIFMSRARVMSDRRRGEEKLVLNAHQMCRALSLRRRGTALSVMLYYRASTPIQMEV